MQTPSAVSGAFRFMRAHRASVLFMAAVIAFAVLLGLGFYMRGRTLMEELLRQRLRDTAAVAVQQFDAVTVDSIRGDASMETPQLRAVVERLREVRESVPGIRYAYIMRRTPEPDMLEFVADADSLTSEHELDADGSGTVEENEEASYPGDTYDISEIPALQAAAFIRPSVDEAITIDQWGYLISGYAPVVGRDGKAVAVLGLDMDADEYLRLSGSIFSPVAFLLLCVMSMLFSGYVLVFMRNRRLEALERVDRERAGLLFLTSHQLGTPLTIFQWSLESIRDVVSKGCDPVELEKDIESMETGCRKLKDILGNLRTASQAESGNFPYKPETGYLRSLIVAVVHDTGAQLRLKDQKVEMDLDGNLSLAFDKQLIGDIVRELLSNASVFSSEGAVITVTAKNVRGMARVTVSDPGCGISRKDMSRLFQKFMRGENAHLSRPDGNGMGLFIAKHVIEKAGGKIWVESEMGKGTTVSFTLPL